jgi:hypothetical protein
MAAVHARDEAAAQESEVDCAHQRVA